MAPISVDMDGESIPVRSRMPERLESLALTPFPTIATKLITLFGDEEVSLSTIAACIATDVTLSAKLIRRANAADQLHYCDVRDVLHATVTLGLDRTRETALATAMAAYAHYTFRSNTLRPCWDHTLACAVIAANVARMWGLPPLECYTAGLLHDIGRLALLTAYPRQYEELLQGFDGESADLVAMENERFGVDHTEAGSWLAARWKLPPTIIEVIAGHHERINGPLGQLTAVKTACRLADLLGFAVSPSSKPPDFEAITKALPDWARNRLAAEVDNYHAAVTAEIQVFDNHEAPQSTEVRNHEVELQEQVPITLSIYEGPTGSLSLGATLAFTTLVLSAVVLLLQR